MATVAPETTQAPLGLAVAGEQVTGRTPRQLFWARFKKDRAALLGLALIVLLVLLGALAPLISKLAGHGPNELFTREMTDEFGIPLGPNGEFIFGADKSGRDLFVRIMYGIRTSLIVGVVATLFPVFIGVVLGIAAGYLRGVVDTIISRTIDVILSMPILLFAIGIAAACSATATGCLNGLVKPGLSLVIFIIAIFTWPYIARIVRGSTLSLREKEFIEAARSVGAGNGRIMFREILPNLVAPIIVYTTVIIPNNILFEAALSFLGLGVPDRIPSLGRMLDDASAIFEDAWWFMFFPGLFLILITLAFNLLGDGLRDALDPRSDR